MVPTLCQAVLGSVWGASQTFINLHDNAGNDSHQMPMTGDIDWKATMDAMHSIDYKGIMCIEYAHGSMPVELTDSFIKLSFETAGYLWNLK